ncbi:MAG: hypothetical protein ACQCN4_07495 [Candidatus Bathyarchaeia archaeon]|jgi:hypothetical protein
MKLRIIKLTPEQLTAILQGKGSPFAGQLPSDTELLDAKVDLFSNQVSLVVRSNSFEDAPETLPVPELASSGLVEPKHASKPVAAASQSVRPVASKLEASIGVAKTLAPSPSRYASKMENEFTPEQRKLLSFTVKDDAVIVKPVSFLKAEWDDINDTVRGLGGRWVKGDIISYWEIPLH